MTGNEDPKDVTTLLCEGKTFQCSRHKLADESLYFKAMFFGQLKESQSKEAVQIHDVTSAALETLITYSETKKFLATAENALYMMEAATLFQFPSVQLACINYLQFDLKVSNCLDVMCMADYLGIKSLFKTAMHFALWEFDAVALRLEVLDLQKERLTSYLSENGLKTSTEVNVFRCLERWIRHDQANREQHLLDMLKIVRFSDISSKDLHAMLRNTTVRDSELLEIIHSINTIKDDGSISKSENKMDQIVRNLLASPPRKLEFVPMLIGHIFADKYTNPVPDLAYYDIRTKLFHKVASLNKVCDCSRAAVGYRANIVGQELYVTGGSFRLDSTDLISAVWSYNILTYRWTFCTNMPHPRRHHATCVLDNYIYIIGGVGHYRIVFSDVARYNTVSGDWESLQPLPQPLHSVACIVHKEYIYVMTNQVLCYNTKANEWTIEGRGTLPNETGIHICFSHSNGIYFMGRNTRQLFLYYPLHCDLALEGTHICVGQFTNDFENACLIDDKIYSFSCDDHCVIEVYDIKNNHFYIDHVSDVGTLVSNHGCTAFPLYK